MRKHLGRLVPLAAALSAWLVAVPARSEITPEARKVVDRYLEVTGGREKFEAIHSVCAAGSLVSVGLRGTVSFTTRAPDQRATEMHLGPLNMREGYDGTTAWRINPGTGRAVKLDGKDLDDAKASAYFDNERWLTADQGGGKVGLAGVETDSLGSYSVLEVTPPVGRPRRLYFNRKSGLLDRATTQRDQYAITTTFSDYRPTAGRLTAFHQLTQIAGMPANDMLVMVDSVAVNPALSDTVFQMPAMPVPAVTFLKTPGVARLPFAYLGRHIWLRASVNGQEPADFLYDTGASVTVIDSAYAARLGLSTQGKLQATGAGSSGNASFSKLQSLRIAGPDGDGVELHDRQVAVLSINPLLAPFFWKECAGVIGYDVISRFVNEIDYDHAVLTLSDPGSFEYHGSGTRLPFTLAGTVPAVHMKIDGKYEGDFRLDVGSNSTVDLHGPFVRQHDLEHAVGKSIAVQGGGFGGTFENHLVRMKRIEIGPYGWDDPLVSLSGAATGALASEDYAGNVGNHILERFKVTLDYEHRAVYLEPGAKYAEPDRFSRAGVQLARFGDTVKAMQVLPGSPAAKAGLEQDDRVLSVDGRPILDYTPDTLNTLFEDGQIGRKIAVEFEHHGKRKKVTLKLAEII